MNQQNQSFYSAETFKMNEWLQDTPLPVYLQNVSMPKIPSLNVLYFVTATTALFFLMTASLLSDSRNTRYEEIDIDEMSSLNGFTKMKKRKSQVKETNRELVSLIRGNGMEPEEFLTILFGQRQRQSRRMSHT